MALPRTFAAPQQAPLPESSHNEESAPEGVKLEHTAKGPRWSIRVHRDRCYSDEDMVNRIATIDAYMREKFGQPT